MDVYLETTQTTANTAVWIVSRLFAAKRCDVVQLAAMKFCNVLCSVIAALNTLTSHTNNSLSNRFKAYMTRMLESYEVHSLIIASNSIENDETLINSVYALNVPVYTVGLDAVAEFNGIYHNRYHVQVTFEESKIYILLINKPSALHALLPQIKSIYFWRHRDRILIVVPEGFRAHGLEETFAAIWRKDKMLNVTFLFIGDRIAAVTYNPFNTNGTINITHENEAFPDKVRNLNGYSLNVSLFPNVIDAVPHKSEGYLGRDGTMAATIGRVLNASLGYVAPNDSVHYGENLGDVGMTGAFADVATGQVAFYGFITLVLTRQVTSTLGLLRKTKSPGNCAAAPFFWSNIKLLQ